MMNIEALYYSITADCLVHASLRCGGPAVGNWESGALDRQFQINRRSAFQTTLITALYRTDKI
jgi:hypothetical protein